MDYKIFSRKYKNENISEFYNFFLKKIGINENYILSNNESLFYSFFMKNLGNIYLSNNMNINYIYKYSKNFKVVNVESIFKYILIYILFFWYKYKKKYNEQKIFEQFFVKENKKLNNLLKIFYKLYNEKQFKTNNVEILSQLFVYLSICDKKNFENFNSNCEIKSFFFYTKSIKIFSDLFLNKDNLINEEINLIENFLLFIRENIISKSTSNRFLLLEYNKKSAYSILNFLKLKHFSQKIKQQLKNILSDIYIYLYNFDLLCSFIDLIKTGLINLNEKTNNEIINDIQKISFIPEFVKNGKKLNENQNFFYLSGKNSGFRKEIKKDKFSLFLSFILKPDFFLDEYILISILDSKNIYFNFSLKKIDNNKYETIFYYNQLKINYSTNITIGNCYNVYFTFDPFEIFFQKNGKPNISNEKNTKRKKSKNYEILIGYKYDKSNNKYISSFEGFIKEIIIFSSNLNENDINQLLEHKNNKKNIYSNHANNIIFKLNPFNYSQYKKQEEIDFVELNAINFMTKKNNFKKFYSYISYNNIGLNNGYSNIFPNKYFNCFFRIINFSDIINKFVELNGIYLIDLIFEYIYQIFMKFNNINKINDEILTNM